MEILSIGEDHKEGSAPARVHCLQIQDAALSQALQAVRISNVQPLGYF